MTIRDWAAARADYENGAEWAVLMEKYGMQERALERHIREEGWQRRSPAWMRRQRLEQLYARVLTQLERSADALESSGADADKLSKLLSAAEKLDKLSPDADGESAGQSIHVDLGHAEEYAV